MFGSTAKKSPSGPYPEYTGVPATKGVPATAAGGQSLRPQAGICRARAEDAIPRQVAEEHVLRECVVEQSPSAANHSRSFAGHIVSKGQAGSEVIEVLAIELIGLIVASTVGGIEGIEQSVLFTGDAEVIPTHAVIQGQARGGTEAVLNEEPVAILIRVPLRIARDLFAAVGNAFQEAREVRETQSAAEIVIDHLIDGGTTEFISEFHFVLAGLPRIVVDEVPVGIDAIARYGTGCADLREAALTLVAGRPPS